MGKYESLIKENLSCLIKEVDDTIKDTGEIEKDKFQDTIEILSNSPSEVYYNNTLIPT